MKKGLFGYKKQEVDELIESLKAKNDALSSRLNHAKAQLEEKEAELEKLQVSSAQVHDGALQKAEERVRELETENRSLNEKLNTIRTQNEEFLKKLGELSEKPENSEFVKGQELEEISVLFRDVYSNIASVRKQVADDIENYINGFEDQILQARNAIDSAMDGINQANDRARLAFVDTAEEILTLYDKVTMNSDQVREYLEDAEEIRTKLTDEVNALLKGKTNALEGIHAQAQEDDALPPRLRAAFQQRRNDSVEAGAADLSDENMRKPSDKEDKNKKVVDLDRHLVAGIKPGIDPRKIF